MVKTALRNLTWGAKLLISTAKTPGSGNERGVGDVTTTFLDATGLRCPLPVLRARKAMKTVAAGEMLEVKATDPSAVADFQSFCETTGDELIDWQEDGGVFVFRIRKAG